MFKNILVIILFLSSFYLFSAQRAHPGKANINSILYANFTNLPGINQIHQDFIKLANAQSCIQVDDACYKLFIDFAKSFIPAYDNPGIYNIVKKMLNTLATTDLERLESFKEIKKELISLGYQFDNNVDVLRFLYNNEPTIKDIKKKKQNKLSDEIEKAYNKPQIFAYLNEANNMIEHINKYSYILNLEYIPRENLEAQDLINNAIKEIEQDQFENAINNLEKIDYKYLNQDIKAVIQKAIKLIHKKEITFPTDLSGLILDYKG